MSETAAEPQPFPCDGCGSTDTDPMIHTLGPWQKNERVTIDSPSFHYDCLPVEFRELLVGPQHAVTTAAIEAAESGVKGEDLRAFIQEQPSDNEIEPELVEEA